MNNLTELITLLNQDTNIKRFKELEQRIDHDKNLQKDYLLLKDLQKQLVQAKHNKSAKQKELEETYNKHFAKLQNHVLMAEYLDLLESINNDLQLIQNIITQEINMDIE